MEDSYLTIAQPGEAVYKERSSKFLAFAYPVSDEGEIKEILDGLRKEYYDATHHCYAWRLGANGEQYRCNDDGEPSGTAGRPILGQMLSRGITQCLIVVVRYFGGTKLGVPGLIQAYRESAQAAIDNCTVIETTVDVRIRIEFPYVAMNVVMRIVKEENPRIEEQRFDNICSMRLSIRKSRAETLLGRLGKVSGIEINSE